MNTAILDTHGGICASEIGADIDDSGVILRVWFQGGCTALQTAVSRLCVGKKVADVADLLSDIDCHGKGTSCPAQLAELLRTLQ